MTDELNKVNTEVEIAKKEVKFHTSVVNDLKEEAEKIKEDEKGKKLLVAEIDKNIKEKKDDVLKLENTKQNLKEGNEQLKITESCIKDNIVDLEAKETTAKERVEQISLTNVELGVKKQKQVDEIAKNKIEIESQIAEWQAGENRRKDFEEKEARVKNIVAMFSELFEESKKLTE